MRKVKWSYFLAKELAHNKKVLIVILLAIGLSTGTNIFVNGMGTGFANSISGKVIYLTTSEILIEPEVGGRFITNVSEVEAALEQFDWLEGYSPRNMVPSIIHDNTTQVDNPCTVIGIEPDKETLATDIPGDVYSGRYLDSVDTGKAVVGVGLARELDQDPNSTFSINVVFPNGIVEEYEVVGIIETNFGGVDDQSVFIMKDDIDTVLDTHGMAMQILVRTNDLEQVDHYNEELRGALPDLEINTWETHADYIRDIETTFGMVLGIVQLLSLIGAVVPVATVLYTSIVNRTKEIGVYKAIGADRGFVLKLYSTTSMAIGIIGIAVGWLIGFLMITATQIKPILLEAPGISYEVSPVFDINGALSPTIMLFVAILIAGFYPALKASKVEPVEAFRFG